MRFRKSFTLSRAAFLPLVILLIGLASWPVPAAAASHEFMSLLDAKAGEPANTLVRLDAKVLQADPQQLSIPLPDGRVLVAFRSDFSRTGKRDFTWTGELQGASPAESVAPGSVRFYKVGDKLYGTLQTEEGAYFELRPEGNLHRLVSFPAVAGAASGAGGDSCGVGQAAARGLKLSAGEMELATAALATETDCFVPASNTTINVMVLYPRSVTASAATMATYANTRIAEANSLFQASNVKITYQNAYVGQITGNQPPPPNAGSGSTGLPIATEPVLNWLNSQFVANDGIDTEVELLRIAYGADMIVVVIPQHQGINCGIANLVENNSGTEVLYNSGNAPFAGRAFAVVEHDCGNADFTFAHELGHNFGMRHNNDVSTRAILPWAYGYLFTRPSTGYTVSTIMGCYSGTGKFNTCSRIGQFSNPDLWYENSSTPTGKHSSQVVSPATPSHNTCVANLRASQYAGFASPPPTSPPSLTITSPAHGATVTSAATLTATASDPQDGNRGAFIQWTSSRQGFLGTGASLNVNFTYFGRHLITATVSDTSGTKIAKSIELLVSETTAPQVWIDAPGHNQQVTGNNVQVAGWAIDHSGIPAAPTFKVDGVTVSLTNVVRTQRADVCAAYPAVTDPNCPNVGWQGTLDTRQMTNGSHTLTMTVTDFFGNTNSTNRTFITQNQATVYLYPTADAWVSESQPTTNFGSAGNLEMRASGSGLAKLAYMKFDLAQVTRPPVSVILQMRTGPTSWPVLNVYSLATTSWGEYTINWNNAPLDPLYYTQFGAQAGNTYTSLDLTNMFPSAGGLHTLGLVTSDNPGHYFLGIDGGFYTMPSLKVIY